MEPSPVTIASGLPVPFSKRRYQSELALTAYKGIYPRVERRWDQVPVSIVTIGNTGVWGGLEEARFLLITPQDYFALLTGSKNVEELVPIAELGLEELSSTNHLVLTQSDAEHKMTNLG
jgi:hypothetical protein